MNPIDPPARARVRRRLVTGSLIFLGLAVTGAAGWFAWQTWGATPKGDQYIFAAIQRGDIEDLVSATGALQPRDYVDVGAQVSGQLKKIHVEVGSEVHEGDLLAEIDAEQLNARVDASRAQLRARQADLVQQEVNLAKAQRDLQRQRNLAAEEATTLEQLQNAETTLAAARATINSTRAGIEQLQASMRVDETNLNYTKIFAPMGGTVASITAKQGQTLNTNQSAPTILRIADLSTMTVQTQVSEADVSRLRTDMPAYFTTLGSQGRRWWGRLKKIEPTPTVTNNVVLYNALFEVPNPNRQLMTQMTAQVFFIVSEARDVLVAPMSALTIARGNPPGPGAAGGSSRERGAATPAAAASATPAASAPGRPGTAGAERPRMDREAFARLSDEERRRLRERRMAQRNAGDGAAPTSAGAPPAQAPIARPPRKATVKVETAPGQIEEREVMIGVSNRVHAQILSGLAEGDRVVAGIKLPEPPRRAGAPSNPQGPGALPGGGTLGPAGARR